MLERKIYASFFIMLIGILALLFSASSVKAVGCGVACGGSITCDAGMNCLGACYYTVNVCSGATCIGEGGYNASSCDNTNQCTPAGSVRTASFGACSVACGVGTKTCNCNNENNCTGTCTGGVTCGGTAACCVDQIPQVAPVVTSVGTGNCSKNNPMTVNWTYSDSGSNCNLSWGYKCGGNTNTFSIKVDGIVNTTGIIDSARTATIATTVAATHQIQVCAENGFGESCSASFAVTIDNVAPSKPTDSMEYIQDPTCLGRFTAKYSWTAATDTGCAGLDPLTPYWQQGSSNSGFSSVLNGWDNNWNNNLTQSSAQSYPPGTQLYFHVQSRDAVDNQSGFTTTISSVIPTPSPFPTMHISGPLVEEISNACYSGMEINPSSLTLQPIINPAPGVTPICTQTSNSYSCNFIIDNQTGQCYGNSIQVQMSGEYPGYGTIGWREGAACSGAPATFTLTPGDPSQTSVPLFFTYGGGSDPNSGNWFKISKSSFNSRKLGRVDVVPNTYTTYDSDDIMSSNIMINSSGVLVQNSPVIIRAGSTTYSTNNWYTNGYQYTNDVSYQKYVDYLKARKDLKTITSVSTANIPISGIYNISGDITLSDSSIFDGKSVVLVVQGGTATFSTNFIPIGGSVAVLANNIALSPSVTQINAILIGETVSTGVSTSGLKIVGNIIDESDLEIERTQPDARKPSLFVVFDPKMHLDVLPYLSTSTYDWRQTQ